MLRIAIYLCRDKYYEKITKKKKYLSHMNENFEHLSLIKNNWNAITSPCNSKHTQQWYWPMYIFASKLLLARFFFPISDLIAFKLIASQAQLYLFQQSVNLSYLKAHTWLLSFSFVRALRFGQGQKVLSQFQTALLLAAVHLLRVSVYTRKHCIVCIRTSHRLW